MNNTAAPPNPLIPSPPAPSAISKLLASYSVSTSTHPSAVTALPLEVLHNLRHQHSWTSLNFHHSRSGRSSSPGSKPLPSPTTPHQHQPDPHLNPAFSDELDITDPPLPYLSSTPPHTLISGTPPTSLYIHPDLQHKLLQAGIASSKLDPEPEWVIPTTLARKWTLRELCAIFDALPPRPPRRVYGKVKNNGRKDKGWRRRKREPGQ
jgi:tRNA-splicing endonuclease subunit Sen15, fungi type